MARKRNSSRKEHKKKASKKSKSHVRHMKARIENLETKKTDKPSGVIDTYTYKADDISITVTISRKKGEYVPIYEVSLSQISETTELVLEKIRQELITRVNLGMLEMTDTKKTKYVEEKFEESIQDLVNKYFPDLDNDTKGFLKSYLVAKSLGLGDLELIMGDNLLEEVVVNEASEPVWVFHRTHGWLKTNVFLRNEEQIRHYASIVARKVGRQITVLEPLLDAHLDEGDRVNATLVPISTAGNTMTIRKFARDPWTITKFLQSKTMNLKAAALIWMAMQYEMSAIIAGGTASGKTSTLNVLATFFPPNQRIISIEDTREIRLPSFLHWVPLNTRLANAEGRGQISMEDLLVNSLRMRPDRILVGEVRRKQEAETLFEAIHTGHSVYATFHANNSEETVERLTNPPINVPKVMLPAISLVVVQFRNRRTGKRRTFQVAELLPDSTPNILLQYDAKKDELVQVGKSKILYKNLKLYTGYTDREIDNDLKEKTQVLEYLVKQGIDTVEGVGKVMAEYYTDKNNLMKFVKSNKPLA